MFWLIGLLIGGNIFFAAMFWQAHRAYKDSDRQFWKLSEQMDERKELIDRLIIVTDKYHAHAQELQHTVDILRSERISPDDLTQCPN